MNPLHTFGDRRGNNADSKTVQLSVLGTGQLSASQYVQLENAFQLHLATVRNSPAGYLVRETSLPDDTRVRIVSNSGMHSIQVWPTGGGKSVVIPRIFSGIIRDGQIVDAPPLVLRDFMPTTDCWTYPLAKSTSIPTGEFSDIKQLAVSLGGGSSAGDSKFTQQQASMYSGLISKAVQVILGYGIEDAKMGLTNYVTFKWKWDDCHGAAVAPDGVVWLLWINRTHGLIATPLPLLDNTGKLNPLEDVIEQTLLLFNGLPSGAGFPSDITAAIADGTVVRLLTAAALSAYFDKTPFSVDVGWSFNDAGSEAHNVVYASTGFVYPPVVSSDGGRYRQQYKSYHYKLDITIGALSTDRAPGDPLAECSATLTLVEEAEMRERYLSQWIEQCAVPFYSSETDTLVRAPTVPTTIAEGIFDGSFPVLVCNIGGEWETVRVNNSLSHGIDAISERFPQLDHTTSTAQVCIWQRGLRDGYIMILPVTTDPDTGVASDFFWNVVTPSGDVIVATRAGISGFGGDADTLVNLSRGPAASSGGTITTDRFYPPLVNISAFGSSTHAVYSNDFDRNTAVTPLNVAKTGALLSDALVPKPLTSGHYPLTLYAFAGYI